MAEPLFTSKVTSTVSQLATVGVAAQVSAKRFNCTKLLRHMNPLRSFWYDMRHTRTPKTR